LHEFGKLVLNRNPENFHRDVEQAAFSPGSMVPGIEDSPEPLLQFRMFFYRDAQYHRVGVNLHQVPGEARIQSFFRRATDDVAVNCPFMASSYSSLNFDGPLRVDANHGMNPQYAPNSFVHKFRPDASEAPYQVADNTVSRKSHFYHEGRVSEYDQPRVLYLRVMNDQARARLHSNTARLLCLVEYPEIQVKYLAQVHSIAPEYAKGVYDLLPEKRFDFSQVERQSQTAERAGKENKFIHSLNTDILLGTAPATAVYNT
jgi:catalase